MNYCHWCDEEITEEESRYHLGLCWKHYQEAEGL